MQIGEVERNPKMIISIFNNLVAICFTFQATFIIPIALSIIRSDLAAIFSISVDFQWEKIGNLVKGAKLAVPSDFGPLQ